MAETKVARNGRLSLDFFERLPSGHYSNPFHVYHMLRARGDNPRKRLGKMGQKDWRYRKPICS